MIYSEEFKFDSYAERFLVRLYLSFDLTSDYYDHFP